MPGNHFPIYRVRGNHILLAPNAWPMRYDMVQFMLPPPSRSLIIPLLQSQGHGVNTFNVFNYKYLSSCLFRASRYQINREGVGGGLMNLRMNERPR